MNSPLPTIPTVDPLLALGVGLLQVIVAKDITSQPTPAAQLARAQAIAQFTGALIEIDTGQASGVADLQTAIQNLVATIKDPATQLIVNELLATFSAQLEALESTIVGKITAVNGELILQQIYNVASYYVQQLQAAAQAAKQ